MEYKLLKDFYTENINMYSAAKRMKLTSKIKTILKVSKGGFDYQKKGILYYVSVNDGQAFKIGITNYNVKQRFKNDFYLKHNKVDPFKDIINSLEKLKEKLPIDK